MFSAYLLRKDNGLSSGQNQSTVLDYLKENRLLCRAMRSKPRGHNELSFLQRRKWSKCPVDPRYLLYSSSTYFSKL